MFKNVLDKSVVEVAQMSGVAKINDVAWPADTDNTWVELFPLFAETCRYGFCQSQCLPYSLADIFHDHANNATDSCFAAPQPPPPSLAIRITVLGLIFPPFVPWIATSETRRNALPLVPCAATSRPQDRGKLRQVAMPPLGCFFC